MTAYFKNYKVYKLEIRHVYLARAPGHMTRFCEKWVKVTVAQCILLKCASSQYMVIVFTSYLGGNV